VEVILTSGLSIIIYLDG
jgi:ABC-type multidrug transport system fused ATPase/permease subunit